MAGRADNRTGFTLVEAVIVVVVIALILTFTISWMRERERARLQAIAESEPGSVFTLECQPTQPMFEQHETICFECELRNQTAHTLTLEKPNFSHLNKSLYSGVLAKFKGEDEIYWHKSPFPKFEIPGGSSLLFDIYAPWYNYDSARGLDYRDTFRRMIDQSIENNRPNDFRIIITNKIPCYHIGRPHYPTQKLFFVWSNEISFRAVPRPYGVMTKLDERLLESQGKTKVRGMREREQERLQLLTRAAPWEVFEFRAKPATATSAGEEVVVLCEIVNTTSSPLTWHNHSDMGYFMLFGDQEHIVGSSIVDDPAQGTVIAPSASVKFELLFYTERVGAAEVVIVPMQLYSAVLSLRFRSNKFHIVVETADDSALPTFDELIANTME